MPRTLLSFLLVGATFAGGLWTGAASARALVEQVRDPYRGLDTFARVLTTVERSYVDPIESDTLIYAAIGGMTDALDSHSLFLDPETWAHLATQADGEAWHLGLELGPAEGAGLAIHEVVPKGPADLAGVHPGDLLLAVDGRPTLGVDPELVEGWLRREGSEPVRLHLLREAGEIDLTAITDLVFLPSVSALLVEPGRAWVRVERFQRRTPEELDAALGQMESEGGGPLVGLILDLRGNPGGLVSSGVGVADLFIAEGRIVEVRGRDGQIEESWDATGRARWAKPRLVVLVDGGSASAAELVSGAIQDHGRGLLVGSPTYGKGSLQHVYEFEDGSALKLTQARYHLPGGRTLTRGAGLVPDREVGRPLSPSREVEALRAELGRIELPAAERARFEALLVDLPAGGPVPVNWRGSFAERQATDPQLEAAWKALREPG